MPLPVKSAQSGVRLCTHNILWRHLINNKHIQPAELSESNGPFLAKMRDFRLKAVWEGRATISGLTAAPHFSAAKPRYSVPMQPLLAAALLLG